MAAAVLVWATDRGLRAAEVRALLLRCAVPLQPGSQDPKRLDLDVAIRATRAQVLIDALEWAPLELNEILAETGMRSEHALAILDELVADNAVFKLTTYRGTGSGAGPGTGATERYHAPRPLFVLYEDLGEAPPSGVRRAQLSEREVLDQIVVRAAKLASRGRFSAQDVHALWQSGQRGRRLTALGALLERPDLDDGTIVADTLRNPRSAFELLQAVKAASAASAVLSSAARAALAATIRQQLAPGGSLAGADGALRAAAEGAVTTPASQANEAGRPLVDRR